MRVRAMRRRAIVLIVISCGFLTQCQREQSVEKRPNIIMIVTDDHARNAISAYGSKINSTPNIDRLARDGMLFRNAFVTNALCGPSRAVILTGKYSHVNGFRDNNETFDNTQPTFPKMLQGAGYYTAVVGKWHLVTKPTGFDYWNILIDQGTYYNPDLVEMDDTTRQTGYTTDIVTDLALRTLERRPSDKPFCLLLHHKAPHRNWMPDFKHLALFDKDTIPLPDTFYDDYSTRSAAAREQDMRIDDMWLSSDLKLELPPGVSDPGSGGHKGSDGSADWALYYNRFTPEQKQAWDRYYHPLSEEFLKVNPTGRALSEWKYQRYIKDYLRCVASVDDNIGRVLDYVESAGLADNTIIIYTSDQGFFLGEHGWYDKRFMYEESMGTPLIVRYPAKVKPSLNSHLVLNLDIAPTLLELTGVAIPSDMQGRSLVPLLRGENLPEWRSSVYYHYYEYPHGAHNVKRHYGVRTDRYKLIHFYNDIDAWELYDLQKDPNEVSNIYGRSEFSSLTDSLKEELMRLRSHYGDTARQ